MSETTNRPVLRMTPSRPRLLLGVAILIALTVLIVGLAFQGDYAAPARIMLLAIGLGSGYLAHRLWVVGQVALVFEDGVLREDGAGGRVLARLANISAVERGAFAFKPSNGFLIRLKAPEPAVWVPGIWWRSRRLVGVGGLLPAHQTRLVSEAMALELSGKPFPPSAD